MAKHPKPSGPTLGGLLERMGAISDIAAASQQIIENTTNDANKSAVRFKMPVISCHSCTAPKGCCTLVTHANLCSCL
jgi:hypothetical protein